MIIRDSQADGGELARLLDFGIAKLLRSGSGTASPCSRWARRFTCRPSRGCQRH